MTRSMPIYAAAAAAILLLLILTGVVADAGHALSDLFLEDTP